MAPTAPIIILLDDEPDILMLLRRLMAHAAPGATVLAAASGDEALSLLASRPVALVITDFSMPDIDGVALTKLIKASWPTTHVALITAYHTPEVERSARISCDSYLPKPFALDDLESLIARVLP